MNYNWDDIEIDDTLTHNSQYFFANYRHSRHEKEQGVNQDPFNLDKLNTEIIVSSTEEVLIQKEDKENNPAHNTIEAPKSLSYNLRSSAKVVGTENSQINNNHLQEDIAAIDHIISNIRMDDEQHNTKTTAATNGKLTKNDNLVLPSNENSANTESTLNDQQRKKDKDSNKAIDVPKSKPKNILTPSKWVKPEVVKNGPQTPKAYQFHNLYQNKRQEALRRQREEERKMREFNSRPAPNFQAKPNFPKIHLTTTPVTPQVLKRSKESERKRQQKLEEIKRQCPPPNFKSHEAHVLKEEPFVPKREPLALQPCPYNLRCERRLQERKKFDQAVQAAMEEKQKQEEERRKQLDEEHVKQLRKATTFKARPNPFKN